MLKKILVEVPNEPQSNHIYYYKRGAIHCDYTNGSGGCILTSRKNLEEVLDIITTGLKVITDEDEITRILTMHELVN